MESLLKQLQRVKSPVEEGDRGSRRRTGPRKSVSFDDGDRKKANAHSRTQLQGDGLVKGNHYSSDGEYEMAVAAATYAINTLVDEEMLSSKRRLVEGIERSATRSKSFKEDAASRKPSSGSDKLTRWLSGKDRKDDREIRDHEEEKMTRVPSRKKGMGDARTIKWAPTFSDKYLNDEGNKKGMEEEKPTPPSSLGKPSLSSSGSRKGNYTSDGNKSSQTDPWEREQMDKIRKSYEKTMTGILDWENEKKIKAKRKLENRERKIERRRAESLQEYKNYMVKIDNIAGGARALADEKKRNDESKMREKAKERRLRGRRSYYSCLGF